MARLDASRSWLAALAVGLAIAMAASFALWQLRQQTIASQSQELTLLSLALSDGLDRGLRGVEEGLQAIRVEVREGRLPIRVGEAEAALRTRAELMPLVQTLWVVDGGHRLLASSDLPPQLDTGSFAPDLDKLGGGEIALSRPFEEARTHEPSVAVAGRLDDRPGAPGGWIIGSVPATALLGAFSAAATAPDARMAVVRDDGARVAGAIVATATRSDADAATVRSGIAGAEIRRFDDGSERLVVTQHLPRYRLTVVLTRNLDAVLAGWRNAARMTSIGLLLLTLVTAGAAYLVRGANRRNVLTQLALQTQLERSGKLQALGTMAGGVAHDFNNVLAAILGFAEMARDAAQEGSEQARELDKVLRATLRGKDLVERILIFSRGGAGTSKVFEIEPIIEEVLALLAKSIDTRITLDLGLEAPGARLRGDPTQAFEAVLNLCTNAAQAMAKGGGMLGVRLHRERVASPRVLSHGELARGDYIALTVSDQGEGIGPEVMDRLFEPFFTTREARSGTGLGLAVVHGVVTEAGGAIDVQSVPGEGARFTLYLPESTEALGDSVPASEHAPRGEGQRILVVDDMPALVDMVVKLLEGLGYRAVGYNDPMAALQAVREDPAGFAAIVTDEVMPGLTGTQLTDALRRHAPRLPVLLVSGFGGALLASRAAAAGVTRVLAKPLRRADLARALAEVLR